MKRSGLIIVGLFVLLTISSACVTIDRIQSSITGNSNETIITPLGKVFITCPIPSSSPEAPVFMVNGITTSDYGSETEVQESGFPICFNATEEWAFQMIGNYTNNADVVIRENVRFTRDDYCNMTYIGHMDVGLGVNRMPGPSEYASATINNWQWKGTYSIRTLSHTLNRTGLVRVVPVRVSLRNLTSSQIVTGIGESQFPLTISKIESGYYHRIYPGRCYDNELWEPIWILTGADTNRTPITLLLWSADEQDIRVLLMPPSSPPRIPGITIHTEEGTNYRISPEMSDYPAIEEECRNIYSRIETQCSCSKTFEEMKTVRNSQWSIEIIYSENLSLPITMFDHHLINLVESAVFTPDNLVYSHQPDACSWGIYTSARNMSQLNKLVIAYIDNQSLTSL